MPTLVCTGCSSGLGIGALSQWCRRLVSRSPPRPPRPTRPWRILAGQRAPLDSTPTPEQRALAALCAAHPHTLRLEWLALDLADSHSVRAFAQQVHARTDKVDALVLNAAVWTADADEAGVEAGGQEWTQEAVVNALGPSPPPPPPCASALTPTSSPPSPPPRSTCPSTDRSAAPPRRPPLAPPRRRPTRLLVQRALAHRRHDVQAPLVRHVARCVALSLGCRSRLASPGWGR